MKIKFIGIRKNANTKLTHGKVDDYKNGTCDPVQLRADGNDNPVLIMRSKNTQPLTWKVVYGYSTVYFRSFAEAVEFCNTRGFRLMREQEN